MGYDSAVVARVLVVEDESSIRNLIQQVLTEAGHEVFASADSLTAMDQVRRQAPNLILLDLFTPRMDGLEFLNVTRGLSLCRDVPS